MFRKFIKNRKATAEVIGSVMFIVILLFFFTNVYLWHDAATKEMNQMYVEKINTPVTVNLISGGRLNVTNVGGLDTTISMVWVIKHSNTPGPDVAHYNFTCNVPVSAGKFAIIEDLPIFSEPVTYKVVTTSGNIASRSYP